MLEPPAEFIEPIEAARPAPQPQIAARVFVDAIEVTIEGWPGKERFSFWSARSHDYAP
jgi:hypothetical protein